MVAPDGSVYVLLGCGRQVVSWTAGSQRWADFGGMLRQGEAAVTAAAREACEESLGLLWSSPEALASQLERDDFLLRVELLDGSGLVWVLRVDWTPDLPYRFEQTRAVLSAMSKICRGIPLATQEQYLMVHYNWFRADARLRRLLDHPAVVKKRELVTGPVIDRARKAMRQQLHMHEPHHPPLPGKPVLALVVEDVDTAFLEKTHVALFSVPQLQQLLTLGLAAHDGVRVSLMDSMKPVLSEVLCFLGFLQGSCAF